MNCGTPSQVGYSFTTSTTTYGSVSSSVACAVGYTGTASSISCQSSGLWTSASGCSMIDCGTPSQAGYTFSYTNTLYGSTATAVCATGYIGTASSVTCQSGGTWSTSSGCTIVSCPSSPTQTGYVISAGSSTYGSTRTVSCSSGYTGTATSITCQSDGSWTVSSGCTGIRIFCFDLC